MKSRLVASAAISALVLLGATGCTFITPQSTKINYSPSDGINLPDSDGPLKIRNALIVATEDGSAGNLIAAIVNSTDRAEVLTIDVDGSDDSLTIRVGAGDTVSLGANADPLLIEDLGVKPGATVEVYFQSGDATGASAQLAVLDGKLPYYKDLVPEEDES